METQSNHLNHWIYGNLEERVVVLAIIIAALSPVVMSFYW